MNKNLSDARGTKNDEFYTQLGDIENELSHYDLKGKKIYCNCDGDESMFVEYFNNNTDIDSVVYTSYDFRSQESIDILKECDVVITNPPFSLFREYITQLVKYDKDFIIIGNKNAISYKEVFPLMKDNLVWVGINLVNKFIVPGGLIKSAPSCWFTNMSNHKRYIDLVLDKKYSENTYDKYDNYDAINIDRVVDIPIDYYGMMGVPITFMIKFNPDQFEIVDAIGRYSTVDGVTDETKGKYLTHINGVPKYSRIIIKWKR